MTCPRCGTQNPANNRFCMKCGADMVAGAPPDATNAGATGAPAEGYSYTAGTGTAGGATGAPTTTATAGSQGGYATGGYSAPGGGYNAAPQFAPPPSSYGAGPNMGVVDQTQLVGFWPRAGAYIIDAIIVNIIGYVLGIVLAVLHLGALSSIVSLLLGILYFGYFWTQGNGQTLGMRALSIRVVREDGQPITWGAAIIRYIVLVVGILVILLGVLWVIWDPKKQGWHDKAAGTLVVRA